MCQNLKYSILRKDNTNADVHWPMLDTLCHTWWHPKIVGVARSRLARWSRCGVLCTTAIERSSWFSSRVPDALPKGRSRLTQVLSISLPHLQYSPRPTPASPWKPSRIMLRRRWELLSPLFAQILGSWGTSWLYLMGFHHFFSFCKKNSLISCLASNRCKGWMLVCGIIFLVA